ncbi:hypothetical protein ACFQ4A_17500 [Lentibacillus salinarum]|uniref:Uncharacterized protein n=1 Tax=Lentibacillus salinarum TaxID=446820 RepID=A0ABW3ZYU2_9BACI
MLQGGQPFTIDTDGDQNEVITPANAFMKLVGEVKYLQEEVVSTRG